MSRNQTFASVGASLAGAKTAEMRCKAGIDGRVRCSAPVVAAAG